MLRSDGGGEDFSKEFSDYLKEQGIQRKYSCRSTPQQNGVVERKNRHIAEVARAMLNEKKMHDGLKQDVYFLGMNWEITSLASNIIWYIELR